MKYAFVFHFWYDKPGNLCEIFRYPIIPNIAVLRGFCKDIPIYVLDISLVNHDWSHWKEKLEFEVIRIENSILSGQKLHPHNGVLSIRDMSMPFDLDFISSRIDADVIIKTETDVFWIANPFPLLEKDFDGICLDANSGFFYFLNHSEKTKHFFRLWQYYSLLGIHNAEFANFMKNNIQPHYKRFKPENLLVTEVVSQFLILWVEKYFPNFLKINGNRVFIRLKLAESLNMHQLDFVKEKKNQEMQTCKFLHFCGLNKVERRAVPFLIKECFDSMSRVLSNNDLTRIYPRFKKVGRESFFSSKFCYSYLESLSLLKEAGNQQKLW